MSVTAPNKETSQNKETMGSGKRLIQILGILKKHKLTKGVDPVKLREILEELGPTFVKIGQIMSTRQDMFSERYCKELVKLRETIAPMSFENIRMVVEDAYGCPLEEVFPVFEREPLGSASIAQVHKACLKNGQEIVVKIQRPHIYEMMERDIALIRRASNMLKLSEILGSVVDINIVLDEFWAAAKQEMDFLVEAGFAQRFAKINEELVYIDAPKIYRDYSTSKVLVMEYIDGYNLDHQEVLMEHGYDCAEIAAKLADCYIKQIVDDGFFHADPHPGNLRIRDGKIVWIDFGMMGQLSSNDQGLIRKAVMAMAEADTGKLVDVILTLGIHHGRIDYPLLYADMDQMMNKYLTMDLADINLGIAIQEVFTVAHQHRISVPKGVSMLARGLVTIESTISNLAPQTNIIRIAAAHMSQPFLKSLDLKKELRNGGRKVYEAGNRMMDLPVQLSEVLRMAMKGQLKVNLEVTDSLQPLSTIDEMVNKMIVTIIAASLLLASSLICTTDMTPKVFGIPVLGFLGYMGAIFLGIWMLFHTHIIKRK